MSGSSPREPEPPDQEPADLQRLLSHDLRGLVAAIRAMARQLAGTQRLWSSSEGPDYMREIERSSDDALELIDHIAAESRAARDRDRAGGAKD